jgi:uroporphyrinogen III methyltransferase/synthase
MARADVVLHDELCGTEVLEAAAPHALRVPVGKRCGAASCPQDRINERLVEEAIRGRRVVRLKTGDPCVYGRLAEEVETLVGEDLSYRVLPGVGAAPAAAAWLGRPLTERSVTAEVVFSTGRFAGGESNRWPCRTGTPPAIAFYMSRRVLADRMASLLDAGMDGDTPVVVVEKVGSPGTRSAQGTVATIAEVADREGVGTPAIVLVGGSFRPPCHLPLHAVRIWLPGEAELAEQQRELLEELGAVCVVRPLIVPEARSFDVNAVFARPFDWLVFTSPKGVDYLFDALREWGHDARWLPRRIAAMGDRTVAKLRERGIEPDLIPPEPFRRSLVRALVDQGLEGKRVLLPCSARAPDEVRESLAPVAGEVVRVDLYDLREPEVHEVPDVDAVLFTSPTTVESARRNGLIDAIRERGLAIGGVGPVTERALAREGLEAVIRPTGYGPDPLARATLFHFYLTRGGR